MKKEKKIKVKKKAIAKIKKPYSKCVELAKKIAKATGGYKCLRCGVEDRSIGGNKQIHGSHIYGIGSHPKMATYPLNIKNLCSFHHRYWHSSPLESGWFKEEYPEWYERVEELRRELEENERGTVVIDYQKRYWELKEILETLQIDNPPNN